MNIDGGSRFIVWLHDSLPDSSSPKDKFLEF